MSKKITYEILLSSDEKLLGKAKKEIQDRYNKKIIPVNEVEYKEGIPREFLVKFNIPSSQIWERARSLISIEGVIDVDPVLTRGEDKVYQNLAVESEEMREVNPERPDPEWYHKNIMFKEALEYVTDEFKKGNGQFDPSKKYKIAQFDTGYTNHPEIEKVNKTDGNNYVAGWLRRIWDKNWKTDARDKLRNLRPVFWASHGTSTAAVILGTCTGNQGLDKDSWKDRVDGLLPDNIDLIPYRVSQNIVSFDNKLSEAASRVINRKDIKVITMSHATLFRLRKWKEAVKNAYNDGIIWVAAAGTHAPEKLQKIIVFPAKFKETIAVASSKYNDEPWERTHYGSEVDLCAPGVDIYIPSSRRQWFGLKPNRYYYKWSEGTSFSTPIVATAAAMWLAHHGEEKLNEMYSEPWQRVEAFRRNLKDSCKPHKPNIPENMYGVGLLDVEKLMKIDLPNKEVLVHAFEKTKDVVTLKTEKDWDEYMAKKELTYHTARAKIHMIDSDKDELYNYVYENSSDMSKRLLDDLTKDGEVSKRSLDNDRNLKSEILKENVRRYIEEYD